MRESVPGIRIKTEPMGVPMQIREPGAHILQLYSQLNVMNPDKALNVVTTDKAFLDDPGSHPCRVQASGTHI